MIKNRKKIEEIEVPEFQQSIDTMPADSKIFVEKSLEIVNYIHEVMEVKEMRQKDLAEKMSKTEAELSKILSGMHNLTLRSISKLEAALGQVIICTPRNASCQIPKTENKNNRIIIKELSYSNIDPLIHETHHYNDHNVYETMSKAEKQPACRLVKMMDYSKCPISFNNVKKQSSNQIAKQYE